MKMIVIFFIPVDIDCIARCDTILLYRSIYS